MPSQLFLSHDSRDSVRAEAISKAISRITLGQITVWHSSDSSPDGGLKPGNLWADVIRARLASSRAVVVLLTPTSLDRPWLYFESGFGAANLECDVIPVCVGVGVSDVPFPLAMYQTYQLSDYDSLKKFIEKLLSKYKIQFDEEMAKPVLLDAIKRLGEVSEGDVKVEHAGQGDIGLNEAVLDIKYHIDKRLISLFSSSAGPDKVLASEGYTLPVDLNLKKKQVTQFVEIADDSTVQDVLDNIYYMLEGKVEPYKYLQEWLLVEVGTGKRLIVQQIQSMIPAKFLFTPGSKWKVEWLDRPYTATDFVE